LNKDTIKKIIPPILLEKTAEFQVFRHRKECAPLPAADSGKDAVIIGNGPSLNETVQKHLDFLRANDCFMVNQSAKSEYFEQIRPRYYVLADFTYFSRESLHPYAREIAENYKKKLNWEMMLLVPTFSKGSAFLEAIKDTEHLNLRFFNSTYVLGTGIPKKKLFRYWNENIANPPSQTVLNTAVSLAISMRYKNIYLVGADTSWIETLGVDQETNDLLSLDKHYYGDRKITIAKYSEEKSNMAWELNNQKEVFSCYQLLKEYAENNGCRLVNASEYSLIDCLERHRL